MAESDTTEGASLDVYGITIDFEPQVGMTVCSAGDCTWVCWDDTVKLAEWLAAKVGACKSNEENQKTADKIRGFGALPVGWHYGEGRPCPSIAVDLALKVEILLRASGYPETDAFPGADGEIAVTGYDGCYESPRDA